MKKLYFIRHMHGKYIGPNTNDQDVDFEKARVFSRRSDATLAFKAQQLDEDFYSIFVLEVSPLTMKHSQVKPAKPTSEKPRKVQQAIRSPDEEIDLDDVLPELNLSSHEQLNPYGPGIEKLNFQSTSLTNAPYSLEKFALDEGGAYIPSYAAPDHDEVTVSPDLNKVKDSAGNDADFWNPPLSERLNPYRWWRK